MEEETRLRFLAFVALGLGLVLWFCLCTVRACGLSTKYCAVHSKLSIFVLHINPASSHELQTC